MKLPAFLFRLLPLWSYICPRCKREVKRNSHKCPYCGERYRKPLKVPPHFLKNKKALERYVHEKIFPRISAWQREYLAQFFTTIFEDDFESGDFSAWSGTFVDAGSSAEVGTDHVHHGSYAAKFSVEAWDSACCYKSVSGYNTLHIRLYVYWTSLPPSGYKIQFAHIGQYGASAPTVRLELKNDNGQYKFGYYRSVPGGYDNLGDITISTNEWHCFELKVVKDSSNGEYKAWYDGDEIVSETGLDTSSANLNYVSVGLWGQGWAVSDIWIDCVVVADTYIGEEGEVTEVQVLDSAAGTEAISRPYRFFSLTDAAFGQEVMLKIRNLSLLDAAIGLEILRKARDIGTITDTAQGLEQILKQRLIKLLDQAAGSETIARPTRIIIMADEALSQEIIGKLREIAAITDSAIGMEYISAGKVSESIKTKIFLFIGDLAIQITGD